MSLLWQAWHSGNVRRFIPGLSGPVKLSPSSWAEPAINYINLKLRSIRSHYCVVCFWATMGTKGWVSGGGGGSKLSQYVMEDKNVHWRQYTGILHYFKDSSGNVPQIPWTYLSYSSGKELIERGGRIGRLGFGFEGLGLRVEGSG